jgi:hypothetical protein
MADIKIKVEGRIATNLTPEVKLVTKNDGYTVEFEFDENWSVSNLKTALFIANGHCIPVPFVGNICSVPMLVGVELLNVGVKSDDVLGLQTTTAAKVLCVLSADDLAVDEIPAPCQSVYDRIVEMINAGMVKGDKGDPFEYEDFTNEQLEALRSELAVDYREDEESIHISGYDPKINMDVLVQKGEFNEELSKKQDTVAFDGVYNAETNKAATVETVIRKVAEIVAGAPQDFDTLKELSEWLISHEGSAAAMNTAIAKNAENIEKAKTETDEKLAKKVGVTDYPTRTEAGAVKIDSNTSGMKVSNGQLQLYPCSPTALTLRNQTGVSYSYRSPITEGNLNIAVIAALTDKKKILMTDDEKAKACETLGAVGEKGIVYDAENESLTIGRNE